MPNCFGLACLTRLYPSLCRWKGMSRGGSSVSERVVEAVANDSNIDVLDLPPLFDSIDPDALDGLVRSTSDGYVSFIYAGQRITVTSRGDIRIEEYSPPCGADE